MALLGVVAPAAACNQVDWQDVVDKIDDQPRPQPQPQPQPEPTDDPCAVVRCAAGTECVVLKSLPPKAQCVPVDEKPSENPCATINCGINAKCVVLESYPPKASCVPLTEPEPSKVCYGSSECGDGLICSTELGVCSSPPGCGAGRACPAVCAGTCVPPKEPQGECAVDADCKLHSNYCGGCSCDAYNPARQALAACPASDAVMCLVDPCDGAAAACVAGKCTVGKGAVGGKCTDAQLLGDDTSCKSYDVWKKLAHDACIAQGLQLSQFSVGGGECDGGTKSAKYSCCSATR